MNLKPNDWNSFCTFYMIFNIHTHKYILWKTTEFRTKASSIHLYSFQRWHCIPRLKRKLSTFTSSNTMVDSFSCHKATFMILSRMHIVIQAGVDIRMSGAPPSAAFCQEGNLIQNDFLVTWKLLCNYRRKNEIPKMV